jgi:hypothetical protein
VRAYSCPFHCLSPFMFIFPSGSCHGQGTISLWGWLSAENMSRLGPLSSSPIPPNFFAEILNQVLEIRSTLPLRYGNMTEIFHEEAERRTT